MKITIVSRHRQIYWEISAIVNAARRRGIETNVVIVQDINHVLQLREKIGDVLLWRSGAMSDLFSDVHLGRSILFETLADTIVLNRELVGRPHLDHKLWQQRVLASRAGLRPIPSWHVSSRSDVVKGCAENLFSLPLVVKPGRGSQGRGVWVIRSSEDIAHLPENLSDSLIQPYIENDGDYRVIVVGGRVLGAIKRVAAEGSDLNNISQGAAAEPVRDIETLRVVRQMAQRIAARVPLHIMGIDVIQDRTTGLWYFLELNTVPEWRGFETITGVAVAEEIVTLCLDLARRHSEDVPALVRRSYFEHQTWLTLETRIHLGSRLWLWGRDEAARELVDKEQGEYIGFSERDFLQKLREIVEAPVRLELEGIHLFAKRQSAFAAYPQLFRYCRLLFRVLFARSLYGKDLLPQLTSIISPAELAQYWRPLMASPDDVIPLATYAINYFYLIHDLLPAEVPEPLRPGLFLDMVQSRTQKSSQTDSTLHIYLLTHCILGASAFYQQFVEKDHATYVAMLQYIEQLLSSSYTAYSLDVKLEFLVCVILCRWETPLRSIILDEAAHSLSPVGNFLIDTHNLRHASAVSQHFNGAEHSNVLYLMAMTDKK